LLAALDLTEIDAQVHRLHRMWRNPGAMKDGSATCIKILVASLEQLQNTHTQLTMANEALRIARFNLQYAQIRASSGGAILQKR